MYMTRTGIYINVQTCMYICLFVHTWYIHKLALLNHFNRGRQPASWNWCPAHPVGFSPVSYISYFIDPTHPPLPIILLPTEPLL